MKIDTPTSPARRHVDYELLRNKYNQARRGQSIVFSKVYNVTTFSQRLEARGLIRNKDFRVENRGEACYLTRLSEATMG